MVIGNELPYNTIKKLVINNIATEQFEIAEILHKYFSEEAMNLGNNLPHNNINPLQFKSSSDQNSIFLAPVTPN